jgi:hypothetical protein
MTWRIYATGVLAHNLFWTIAFGYAAAAGELDRPSADGSTIRSVLLLMTMLVSNLVLAWRAVNMEERHG